MRGEYVMKEYDIKSSLATCGRNAVVVGTKNGEFFCEDNDNGTNNEACPEFNTCEFRKDFLPNATFHHQDH